MAAETDGPGANLLVGVGGACVSVVVAASAVAIAGVDSPTLIVVACLAFAWAIAGVAVTARQRCPAAVIIQSMALVIAVGVLAWSLDDHRNLDGFAQTAADLAQSLALALTPAIILHLLLTLPDGRVMRPSHRRLVSVGYLVAAATGIALGLSGSDVWWPIAACCGPHRSASRSPTRTTGRVRSPTNGASNGSDGPSSWPPRSPSSAVR